MQFSVEFMVELVQWVLCRLKIFCKPLANLLLNREKFCEHDLVARVFQQADFVDD